LGSNAKPSGFAFNRIRPPPAPQTREPQGRPRHASRPRRLAVTGAMRDAIGNTFRRHMSREPLWHA
jgi:hypothetical protein